MDNNIPNPNPNTNHGVYVNNDNPRSIFPVVGIIGVVYGSITGNVVTLEGGTEILLDTVTQFTKGYATMEIFDEKLIVMGVGAMALAVATEATNRSLSN